MTEPLRNHGDHGGATAVYVVHACTAVAPHLRCDGGIRTHASVMNTYRLNADPLCNPTSTLKMPLSPVALRTCVWQPTYMSCISLPYFSDTSRSLVHLQISHRYPIVSFLYTYDGDSDVLLAFPVFFFYIVCQGMKIVYVVRLPGMSPNWLS